MNGKYTAIYPEILAAEGPVKERILAAMAKYNVPLKYRSFERMYIAWRNYNGHVEKKPKTYGNGNLSKLETNLNQFNSLLDELVPGSSNPLDLPPSQESNYQPFKLPINHNNILLLYAISRFEKDPRKRNFGHEVLMTRQFLQTLRKLFPNAAIYYKCGNHDVRYDHYIMRNAPDLLGMNEFSFESLMKLDELNITFIPDKQVIHAGNLTILHGHELGASVFSPVNIARGLFLRAKANALCGHHHQASEHTEPNINGKITTCWSVACLCELHPDYLPINKHHHGFAHVRIMDSGDFEVSNYRIVNGKIR